MEFGALLCTPDKPRCSSCPLLKKCYAHNKKVVNKLPVKSKKTKVTQRFLTYFHLIDKNNTYIYLRKEKDIWKNLYEFPVVETNETEHVQLIIEPLLKNFLPDTSKVKIEEIYTKICHKLSHQKLNITFVRVRMMSGCNVTGEHLLKIPEKKLETFPFHALMEKYLLKKFSKFAI
ncbi:MAG: hypothetical protein A2491_18345 [Bacteroidetes bacterium RIFOXYC12_FULL_35_7]|nr:MAG: hypothetical protein A2491_18345 [Bacteroidetes bacterium RIFOXYC12_FULL_35_7]